MKFCQLYCLDYSINFTEWYEISRAIWDAGVFLKTVFEPFIIQQSVLNFRYFKKVSLKSVTGSNIIKSNS